MDKWIGKVAVVTGASSGIGAGISMQLVETGLIVVGLARRLERLKELESKLLKAKGKFYPIQCDVCKQDDILHAFEWIENHVGTVSILVNNAGILRVTGLVHGDSGLWNDILNTNFFGVIVATKEAIKSMRKTRTTGYIIFINSTAGLRSYLNMTVVKEVPYFPCYNLYAASKHAMTRYAGCLREEIASHNLPIRISNMCLGYVETEIIEAANYTERKELVKDHTAGMQAEDIVDTVDFILSAPPHIQIPELIINPVGW